MTELFKKIATAATAAALAVTAAFSLASCGSKDVKIGIPDDGTNQSRAIKLLEKAGFIEVDPAAGYTPELKDITKYNYNVKIIPTTANTLTNLLGDYGACTINGTYATSYNLSPSKDALIIEKQDEGEDNPYVNILVARTADKDNETYQKIIDAYHSQTVAQYLLEKYSEAYFPAFEYDAQAFTEGLVEQIDGYSSDKAGKTTVKIGVVGSANAYWNAVQKVLDERNAGIYIERVEFTAYNLPNDALDAGEIDLNAFQHKAYLQSEIAANGYALSVVGETLIAPLSLYSQKYSSLEEIKNAAGIKQ